ncbi:hypothetical protein [Candidatus Steffania adelgidicola]|nr:hypothetical protein [Candidatus Steffania adelgidicola]
MPLRRAPGFIREIAPGTYFIYRYSDSRREHTIEHDLANKYDM